MALLPRVLGILDLLVVLAIFFLHQEVALGWKAILLLLAYLGIRAYAYRGSMHSRLDIAIGVWLVVMAAGFVSLLDWIPSLYLLGRGALALL